MNIIQNTKDDHNTINKWYYNKHMLKCMVTRTMMICKSSAEMQKVNIQRIINPIKRSITKGDALYYI